MSNMSYCRFANTLEDLRDCYDNWDTLDRIEEDYEPNPDELRARVKLLRVCQDIIDNYGEEE